MAVQGASPVTPVGLKTGTRPLVGSDRADAASILPTRFADIDNGAGLVRDAVAELASIHSRHLSSCYHISANVRIPATASRPRTTAWAKADLIALPSEHSLDRLVQEI